jgi:hypothetical protein
MGGLCCSANEICRESKRQTINADDVLKAVEELDFPEFCEPLKAALAGVCLSLFAGFLHIYDLDEPLLLQASLLVVAA